MEESESSREYYMVGTCPNHGYVAGDAIDGKFPNTVHCNGCGEELEKCISAPATGVEENGEVTMQFED